MLRRSALQAIALPAAAAAGLAVRPARAQTLEKVRFGVPVKTISPSLLNFVVAGPLGYYKEEGIDLDMAPLGSASAVIAALHTGRLEMGVVTNPLLMPMAVKGEPLPVINFFEYAYPFKWAMAVKPDSPVKALTDLKGKRIGVANLSFSDFPVGKSVLRLAGLDGEKDVEWLAVGEGISGGQALMSGQIDGLFTFDGPFGTLEAAGLVFRYLPLPPTVPKVGGQMMGVTHTVLKNKRHLAVAFGRAIAKANLFVMENPEAAAFLFLKENPEAAPRGKSLEEQVRLVKVATNRRVLLYKNYDPAETRFGYQNPNEYVEELKFQGLEGKLKDINVLFTNELIADINKFDREKVRQQARAFKLPYR